MGSPSRCLSSKIKFNQFRIYLNHRPYKPLDMTKMSSSFDTLRNFVLSSNKHKDLEKYHDSKHTNDKCISRETFFRLLSEQGESIPESELMEILRVIRGDSNIKSTAESMSFQYLFEELLRFEVSEETEEKEKDN
jgi:hypothetical protein